MRKEDGENRPYRSVGCNIGGEPLSDVSVSRKDWVKAKDNPKFIPALVRRCLIPGGLNKPDTSTGRKRLTLDDYMNMNDEELAEQSLEDVVRNLGRRPDDDPKGPGVA